MMSADKRRIDQKDESMDNIHPRKILPLDIHHMRSKSPFDACKNVFDATFSLDEKQESFFTDYNLMPNFVYENYVRVRPSDANEIV